MSKRKCQKVGFEKQKIKNKEELSLLLLEVIVEGSGINSESSMECARSSRFGKGRTR